jgi:hypothetical protein
MREAEPLLDLFVSHRPTITRSLGSAKPVRIGLFWIRGSILRDRRGSPNYGRRLSNVAYDRGSWLWPGRSKSSCRRRSTDRTTRIAAEAFSAPERRFSSGGINRGKGIPSAKECSPPPASSSCFRRDLSTRIGECEKLFGGIEAGGESSSVAGPAGSDIRRRQNPVRERMGWCATSWSGSSFSRAWDTQCGFKLFRRDAASSLSRLLLNGFSFEGRGPLRGRRLGYKMARSASLDQFARSMVRLFYSSAACGGLFRIRGSPQLKPRPPGTEKRRATGPRFS